MTLSPENALVLRADTAKTIEIADFPSVFSSASTPSDAPRFESWREELDQLRQAARDEGYRDGFEAGRVEGLASTSSELRAAAEQLLAEWRHLRELHDQQVGPLLADAALEIAALVLATEVRDLTQATQRAIAMAAESLPQTGPLSIRLHPGAVAAASLDSMFGDDATLIADPSIAIGDCVVKRGSSTTEVRIDDMLHRIRAALTDVISMTDLEGGPVNG